MLALHRALALLIVLGALAGTIWAVHGWLGRGALSPRLLTATGVMAAAVAVQAVFGIVLAVSGDRPVDGTTHFIVGPVTLLLLPAARWLAGRQTPRGEAAVLAVAWFGLLLLSLRAVGSGGGLNG